MTVACGSAAVKGLVATSLLVRAVDPLDRRLTRLISTEQGRALGAGDSPRYTVQLS